MEHKEKTDNEDKHIHRKRLPERLNQRPYKRRPSGTIRLYKRSRKPTNKSMGSLRDIVPKQKITKSQAAQRKSFNVNALPQISERHGTKQYNFKGLHLTLNAQELERYKMIYFDSESIWQRLLPQCDCDLCDNGSSIFDPILKRVKTPYKLKGNKGFKFKKSFSLYSSNMDIDNLQSKDSDDSLKQQQSILGGLCSKEKTTALIYLLGLGVKNNKHNFMHILNDINSKLILKKHIPSIGLLFQKSAPHAMDALSPISDDASLEIQKARTWNESEAYEKPTNHQAHQSLSSYSRDSSYCHPILSDSNDASNSNSYDSVPILNVHRLYKITSLHAAIRTYHKRLAKPLDFKPQYRIRDDVNEIVDTVKVMTHVVKCFAKGHSMPFQIDIAIVPKSIESKKVLELKTDIVSDGDDEDEDDGDFSTDDEDWNASGDSVKAKDEDRDYIISDDIGEMLKNGLLDKHSASFHKQCIPLIRSDDGIHLFKQYIRTGGIDLFSQKNPMQNGRYVIVVDRRNEQKHSLPVHVLQKHQKDQNKDTHRECMYFFQPPKPYGEIIDHCTMIETLHLNTLECLIPKVNHKLHSTEDNKEEVEAKEEYIGAKHLCKTTGLICVSFHVLSVNVIRCYLYMDQKYMRIGDWSDLSNILEHYCNEGDVIVPFTSDIPKRTDKYKDFAFPTKDKVFDAYFRWAQDHPHHRRRTTRNQLEQVSKTKQSDALDIGGTPLTEETHP